MVIEPRPTVRGLDESRPFQDPLLGVVTQMNLPFLAYAGGVLPVPPDDMQTSNIEMWTLEQIYKLRSDLIALSLLVDEDDAAIQSAIEVGLEDILGSLREAEDQEPLRLDLTRQPSDWGIRPASPGPHQRPRSESERRLATRPKPVSPGRGLTPETIWENVDLYMKPVEKLSAIHRLLGQSTPIGDKSALTEPIGPHYSSTLPKTPAFLSDPHKSKLIIPPPPSELTGSVDGASHLHARLISALVPLLGSEEPDFSGQGTEDSSPGPAQLLKDLRRAEMSATPLADCCGFTMYSWLTFEEKLSMELKFAGIEGPRNLRNAIDSPILQDLADSLEMQEEIQSKAVTWRRTVSDMLSNGKQKVLEERMQKERNWNLVMNNFMAQEKAKG
jgi:hypothetical protein